MRKSESALGQWRAVWGDEERMEEHGQLLRFLYEPAAYVHRSRLAELSLDLNALRAIGGTRRGWVRINKLLLKHFHLNEPSDCGPGLLPRQRLIFAKSAPLGQIASLAGALCWAREIQKVVLKKERKALLDSVGEMAYGFALRKFLFFNSLLSDLPRKHFANLALPQRVMATGRWCVMLCLNGLADDVKRRFLLKFATQSGWGEEKLSDREGPLENIWTLVDRLHGRLEEVVR
ncbi:MAG: Yop proteins translocation protein K [Puniceicoccales bacterium]|jgi:hypothetical protein|nr:Yop proteins translocation protein K [Puniceicoccales bacterium]